MRVVAGKYKGFNLVAPKGSHTRPTENKIKEAIFDMLYPINTNGIALDLFAGSGQMGIEFLSRDLKLVYFNELNRTSYKVLTDNLNKIKADNYEISRMDYKDVLKTYRDRNLKFDYIFLDPPYGEEFLIDSVELIMDYELLNVDGIVITESDKDIRFDDKYDLNLFKEKTYGRKLVNIYLR